MLLFFMLKYGIQCDSGNLGDFMSIYNKNETVVRNEILERGEMQLSLMKIMAEQNHDKFMEYDRETDTLILSEVRDGHFHILETIESFISREDMKLGRIYEKDQDMYRREIQVCLAQPKYSVFDIRYMVPDFGPRWYRAFLMSVGDETGYVTKFVARMSNIHEQKSAQENMKKQAERDLLSGVFNHATYERLCTELADKVDDGLLYLMVDIDNFKQINDTCGHHEGDKIIQHVGTVLESCVKGKGYAGRIGGDEFSVCFYDVFSKEDAKDICTNLKVALGQYLSTVGFSVSIGATMSDGRRLNFHELYFEADEAVYFAKENGKNQIVFRNEIQKLKQERFLENKGEYSLSEEEIVLDQKIQYITIVEPVHKKLLYMNEAGRNRLGLSLEEVQNMHCYQLFKGCDKECEVCALHANHAEVLDDQDSVGLRKYVPDGKFILQSRFTMWKGDSARTISFIDVNDATHVERCMEAEMQSQEVFSKCWSLIMESNSGDTEYENILRVIADYYNADCTAIVTKTSGTYNEIFEYHKNSGQGVADGLRVSLEQNMFDRCEVLLDADDFMRPRHIQQKLLEYPDLAEALEKKFVHNTIGIALRKFGDLIGILMVINPRSNMNDLNMLSQLGVFFGTDLVRKHLTDSKTFEENHDVLTKLWSREFFNKDWMIDYYPIFKDGMGVFTADIYRLKDINKQLGYQTGNKRIIAMADMLRQVFTGYSMFRYDDDQVIAICHNVNQRQFQKMVDYAKELIKEMDFEISYGYSWKQEPTIPEGITEAEAYLEIHRAYLEKENAAAKKLAKKIEKDVLAEIREGNFRMFLQPKVNIHTGKTVGAEALIRLYHPEKGFISPAMFIPVLEQQNEVHMIDLFILGRAFQFQKAARDAGREIVPISVNFSKNTLMYPKLMDYIMSQCEMYGMPRRMIRIEITETISNMDHMEVSNIARELRTIGFSISMDDFGTQYSNMAVLTQFDFDTVKIDRSMILNIVNDEKSRLILKHTIAMLKELGMEIIIEGVETEEQVQILSELGCDIVQGFYFGRPDAEEKFYELYM